MNKHTIGPWGIVAGSPCAIRDFNGNNVANDIPNKADARLIAAAPELLAVLLDIVRYVSPGDDVPLWAMLNDARAALAKAGLAADSPARGGAGAL